MSRATANDDSGSLGGSMTEPEVVTPAQPGREQDHWCAYCQQSIYLHQWQQGPPQWIHFGSERAECRPTVATPTVSSTARDGS